MVDASLILNPLSELFAVGTHGNYKNLILIASHLKGPLDVDILQTALRRTADQFPEMTSGIRQIWRWGRFLTTWERRPNVCPNFKVSELQLFDPSDDGFDWIVRHLKPRLDRGLNLREDVASEFHLVRLASDHHVIVAIMHHAAADGGRGSDIHKAILEHYYEIRTGRAPERDNNTHSLTTYRRRPSRQRSLSWKERLFLGWKPPWPRKKDFGLPIGSGTRRDKDYHCSRRIFSLGVCRITLYILRSLGYERAA
jgi:hypothetical protein